LFFGTRFANNQLITHTNLKMKTLKIKIATYSIALASLGVLGSGCDSLTKTQKGAAIGAGAGGTIGAFIGKAAGNTALGAIIGGAVVIWTGKLPKLNKPYRAQP
jgi:hypothetical protein